MQLPRLKFVQKTTFVLLQSGLPFEVASLFLGISKELSMFKEDAVTESLMVLGFNNTEAEQGPGRVFLHHITCLEASSHLVTRKSDKLKAT